MFRTNARTGLGIGRRLMNLGSKFTFMAMAVLLVLLCSFPALAEPEKPYTIGGEVYVNGKKLTQNDTDYTITLEVDGVELVSYTMGDYAVAYYTLSVPMDTDSEISDKGFPGNDAYIYFREHSTVQEESCVLMLQGNNAAEYLIAFGSNPDTGLLLLEASVAGESVTHRVRCNTTVGVRWLHLHDQ